MQIVYLFPSKASFTCTLSPHKQCVLQKSCYCPIQKIVIGCFLLKNDKGNKWKGIVDQDSMALLGEQSIICNMADI